MAGYSSLQACAIVEKDTSSEVMLTWAYPSLPSPELKAVVISRSRLASDPVQFSFSRYDANWLYMYTAVLHEGSTNSKGLLAADEEQEQTRSGPLPRVNAFTVTLLSKEFNPELHGRLASLFAKSYTHTGSPIDLLKAYLSVLTRGTCTLRVKAEEGEGEGESEETFEAAEYDRRSALLATPLKDVIAMLGMESILVWTALMMRKRIVVFCDRLSVLLKVIRAFPLFVSHRQDWDILRPFVNCENVEIDEMKKQGVYCAGFTDNAILSRTDLYDIYVDVNARSVSVADQAKADFRMGGFHKDLAQWMVSSAEDPDVTNQQIVRELSSRTKGFLKKVESLQIEDEEGNTYVSMADLQERQLPPNMDRFVFAVANAEGLSTAE
eukprot:TRINITY_DN2390_c1_g1_i1.p1 TRINITY_DN2390_c1_g1~~TRINITY_DN2390_c1_g1_i1.p1  ORF type:complete len:381 (-),score=109.80 TRINITY_DN2390_c1_g1_i1:186-1328(-)